MFFMVKLPTTHFGTVKTNKSAKSPCHSSFSSHDKDISPPSVNKHRSILIFMNFLDIFFFLLDKPVSVRLYVVIDSFHDIREDQMVRSLRLLHVNVKHYYQNLVSPYQINTLLTRQVMRVLSLRDFLLWLS